MSEKHKLAPAAWARMKGGRVISVFHDKGVAEFLSGFAASELVPLYMHAEQPAPAVQGEPVAFCEDATLSIAERTFSTEVDEQLASDIIQYAQRLHSLYTAPKPAGCTLNSDREQVTEVEAPSHSLPKWSECNLRVGNSKWLKDNNIEADHDSLTANPLHEFIYEYDDSDAYKSAWFLHRLENLIDFIRSEQRPSPDVAVLVEALERINGMDSMSYHSLESAKIVARTALAAYRKQGGDT